MNFFKEQTSTIDTYINSTVYSGMSIQGEGIDLRLEMNGILYGSADRLPKGHWVILRKYDFSKPSAFYNVNTKEGIGGYAYDYTDMVLRTRRVPIAFKGQSLAPTKAGDAVMDRYIYYFEYTVKPKRGDHIIELSIDDHTIQPTISNNILSDRYKITSVHPYRLENGNVQYYATQAEYDEVTG